MKKTSGEMAATLHTLDNYSLLYIQLRWDNRAVTLDVLRICVMNMT